MWKNYRSEAEYDRELRDHKQKKKIRLSLGVALPIMIICLIVGYIFGAKLL